MKKIVIVILVLTSLIGIMLLWQWDIYFGQKESLENNTLKVKQQIVMEARNEQLFISQKIIGLKNGKEYTLHVPKTIYRFKCVITNEENCKSLDDNPNSFLPKNGVLEFQYVIPIQINTSSFLLNDWTVKVNNTIVENTMIETVNPVKRKGTWVAGIPIIGKKEHEFIDYSVFKGMGEAPSMYWEANTFLLVKGSNDAITYFINKNFSNIRFRLEELSNLPNFPFVSIVLTNEHKETISNGLIISPSNIKEEDLKRKLISYYYEKKITDVSNTKAWIVELLTALYLNESGKINKVNSMINELKEFLTDKELDRFLYLVNSKKIITIENLDKIISDVKGLNTHFFTLNRRKERQFVPMYFYDDRELKIIGERQKNLEVILKDGKTLFPLIQTLTAFGFEIKILNDQQSFLLSKGNNTYKFFINKDIFIYNNNEYGFIENPFSTLNGKIYIEKKWLSSLFKIKIDENSNFINMTLDK